VVFLDEPTSGLDPLGRRDVRDLIRELREQGVTVFLNSHFLSEVEVTCDRVAIVKRGRVVRLGPLAALTRQATEIELHVAGLTPEAEAGLAQWGRIVARSALGAAGRPDGVQRLILAVPDEEIAPALAAYLIGAGAQIYALAPRRLSLEELFMRVMQEEA
jgi:ABC-2 type transport system ATP-binding protein